MDGPGLVVTGASGRMGRTLVRLIGEAAGRAHLVGAIERPGHPWIGQDVGLAMGGAALGLPVTDDPLEVFARAQGVIDFTTPAATVEFAGLAAQVRAVHVIGTTGLEAGHLRRIEAAARHAVVVRAGNMSLGVNLLTALTRKVAEALGMWYVYYPAILHRRTRRDFGNAVLARWPIVEDEKLVLPHPSRYARTHRIATAATLLVGGVRVRAYSTHLGTVADVGAGARRGQLRAVLDDARRHDAVIVGGDLNDGRVGEVAARAGFAWPTRGGPRTTRFGRWDHVFLKGLDAPPGGAGVGPDVRGVSDHRPVWALAVPRTAGAP